MRKIFILVVIVAVIGFAFMQCTPEQREHLNSLDPEYSGTSNNGNGDEGGGTTPTYHTGVISFDSSSYIGTNTSATITLTDADLTDSTVNVNVKSSSDATGITVTLNKGTSSYTGTVGFTTGTSGSGKIQVASGDTVTVSYNDANPSGIRTDTATWSSNGGGGTLLVVYDGLLNSSIKGVINNQGLDFMHNSANGSTYSFASNVNNDYMMYQAKPGHGGWAFIAIYVKPAGLGVGSRDYIDISSYTKITYKIKSTNTLAPNIVSVALKDRSDPDNGSETAKSIPTIDSTWRSYTNNLSDFTTLDKSKVYMQIEFKVGSDNVTIYFDDVKYLP